LSEQAYFILQTVIIYADFQHKSSFLKFLPFIDVQNADESHPCC